MKLEQNKQYALIENAKVSYIFSGAEIGEIDENSLQVVEIPQEKMNRVWIGCDYTNGELQDISLDDAKAAQVEYINNRFDDEVAQLQGKYVPKEEVLTFEMQRVEATDYMLNKDKSRVPFLAKLAESRNVELDTLASKIIEKNKEYSDKLAVIIGYRHKVRDSVLNASNYDEILSIKYKSPFGFE